MDSDSLASSEIGRAQPAELQQSEAADSRMTHVLCAFCQGEGRDPFGLMSPLATCQVCGGRGVHTLHLPVARCAFCRGSGVYPSYRVTCTTCRGIGTNEIPANATTCPGCRGSGRERDHEYADSMLSCSQCRGKGVVSAEQ